MTPHGVIVLALAAMLLTACAPDMETVGQPPSLTPVGSGLGTAATAPGVDSMEALAEPRQGWIGGSADFFRDARAHRQGDLITVKIAMNDQAAFNSTSSRSRKSSADADVALNYSLMGVTGADVAGKGGVNSNTSAAGQGATARSERIQMSIAAVVTRVLPNGYLLIEGSQEVAVNYEQRTLHVTGVIRPADISPDNTISYEKIAEARIAYGGRGRINEVQQPGWAHQIWDRITPF